ncbi:MAG: RidA family protein [Proteobacteria bacterium]|nr:RidA family protein [Desulfobacula sp.]MBU4130427.1 RidA family protein [Pseudomonadota bacterium]
MEIIIAQKAPGAVGPYSHAVVHNGMAFCSGQIPLDPVTMEITGTTIETQTEQVMKNIAVVLKASGSSLDKIIKTTVFLSTMDSFAGMNKVYEAALKGHKPARSTFAVAGLPKGALVEIECIAALG